MGLIRYAAAVGLGYTFARPEGRRQLLKLRDQAQRVLQHPRVVHLQDRGQHLATERVTAVTDTVKQKLGRGGQQAPVSPYDDVVAPPVVPPVVPPLPPL